MILLLLFSLFTFQVQDKQDKDGVYYEFFTTKGGCRKGYETTIKDGHVFRFKRFKKLDYCPTPKVCPKSCSKT